VEFDPFLYVAFAVGFGIGRLVPTPGAWVRRATLATVVVLVALLGASLNVVPLTSLAGTIPLALGFAVLILGLTAAVFLLLSPRRQPTPPIAPAVEAFPSYLVSVGLLGALGAGLALGRTVRLPVDPAIEGTLYVLVALVALGVRFRRDTLRRAAVPLASAVIGSLLAAAIAVEIGHIRAPAALATTLAFGWYSLAGPLVASRAGAVLGLLAFLTNYLREDLTMLLSPVVGHRLGAGGLTALGGATAMDTTLYFVTRFGDRDGGGPAVASGLALTVAASLVVPLVLAL
jgi:uncharacterized membrane protein YbjE (DUF340 family)